MDREELHDTLASLHQSLGDTSDVDPETRDLLLSVTADIERVLADDQPPGDNDDSLSQRVTDMMRDFEVHHPVIGGLLQRLADGLSNLGI